MAEGVKQEERKKSKEKEGKKEKEQRKRFLAQMLYNTLYDRKSNLRHEINNMGGQDA